ncbi:MAG: pyridoxal-phosphate dependent enzyme, partial [Acidiferrobacterales bacterium]|nr:pyridoxal-phosphate dependent enzyme [Acidiferrobacterales bacterium]
MSVSAEDISLAAGRLDGIANRTPVVSSRTLNRRAGASVHVKCENLQRTGSFKFRGAYNALAIMAAEGKRAALTYSSGNHAQALALAGNLLGVSVTVIMPSDAPAVKREATRDYGADIIEYERSETTREALAARVAHERSLPIVPPYDHPDVVAGQGTVGLELLSERPELDV